MTAHWLVIEVVLADAVVSTVMSTTNVIDACGVVPNELIRTIDPLLLDTRCCCCRCCSAPGGANWLSSVWPRSGVTRLDSRAA